MERTFRRLAIATAAATLLLIAWGGVVRATGSGDGCPDWPTCFGSWVPRLEYHTLIEYTHRFLAFVAGTLSLVLCGVAVTDLIRSRGGRRPATVPAAAAWGAVALAPLFLAQAAIGGWIIASGEDPGVVTLHFAVAFLVLGLTIAIAIWARPAERGGIPSYARITAWTAAATYGLLLVGTYVRAEGAGLAFRDWPLMDGRLLPDLSASGAGPMFAHRLLAIAVTALVIWCLVRARTMVPRSDRLVRLATLALALLVGQILIGGANVLSDLATWARAGHVAMSALVWAAVVALAVTARREPTPEAIRDAADRAPEPATEPRSFPDTISAFVALTKPRIIVLLLITTVPAMLLAQRGIPSLWLILATLIGGTLAAGAANAINMYLDRDIDEVMRRTRRRPLPGHRVHPDEALRFGFALAAVSFTFLALTVNVLAATLALSAIAFYVFVYTMWLKRSTPQNIVIGGAAGAVPVLVGWAAVTGGLAWPAWVLFATIFVWTPPHFWALAMRVQDDYAAAGVPMLPVVRGEDETRRQIFLYALVLFGTTLLLVPVASMGPVYLATAVVLGGTFVFRALQLWRRPSPARAWKLFTFSIVYLAALFAAVAVDAVR
ncbi:MAG TPA: heme o synthase [Actinomycetota bacterium]|nr:heme o synthase [Actinomycetota bacterium]